MINNQATIAGLEDFNISHVFQEGNELADHLANLAVGNVIVKWWSGEETFSKTLCDLARNDAKIYGLPNEIYDGMGVLGVVFRIIITFRNVRTYSFPYLWFYLLLDCLESMFFSSFKMGGEKNRFKPTTYDKQQKNKEVWEEISNGGMVPFLERLHGHSVIVTERFVKGWNKGVLTAFSAEFHVDENLVTTVTAWI